MGKRRLALLAAAGVLTLGRAASAGDGAMPPQTVMLSTMMQALSQQPGFTDQFLAKLAGGGQNAALPLSPDLRHDLRELILGRNWQGLDHFPGWTMDRLNPIVAGIQDVQKSSAPPPAAEATLTKYVDLGAYPLGRGGTVSLDRPATGPGFELSKVVVPLLDGVTSGDGPDPALAPLHAESQRLADGLNRLSLNRLDFSGKGVQGVPEQPFAVEFAGRTASSPEQLIAILMATGHHVEVDDSRYFANFGSFNWQREGDSVEVEMPFWLDSEIPVPNTKRTLLVPVSHAEYEWHITGPHMNAAVSFWFGIDGKTEFRTMDQVEQRWVMRRHAHVYTDAQAVEVTRLAGAIALAYARLHLAHPALPFGGYYTLGVCQDVVAAIELKMTGTTTLFPNTASNAYFTDPQDAEVNGLIRRLPKDGHGKPPEVARVFGSLPLPADDAALAKVTVPGLAPDLIAVNDAWKDGSLEHPERRWLGWLAAALLVLAVVVFAALAWRRRRTRREA